MTHNRGESNKNQGLSKKWLTTEQACDYLGVGASFLRDLARKKKITRYKHNNRCCFFKIEELDAWVESLAETAEEEGTGVA